MESGQSGQPVHKGDDQHAQEKYLGVLRDDNREQTAHLLPSGTRTTRAYILLKASEGGGE